MAELPISARVVVIGGGIVGCSTAYHLAHLGLEVLLLERHRLTSGSTFHAAGLVGQLRSNAGITELLGYSVDLYRRLETETGLATGWKMNGGLRLACSAARWTEVRRQATTARSFGLEMQLLSPGEARDLWPLMRVDDLVGAAFLPTDGQANPSDITMALARGARRKGALIVEGVEVTGLDIEAGAIRGVETSAGRVGCAQVVLCAGQWSRDFAARYAVSVPLVSMQHQYMVTEPIAGVSARLPTLRDPDRLTYYKEEVGGLVMGGYEPDPRPWALDGVPEGFQFSLLDADFDHFEPLMKRALGRVPALERAGVKTLTNGPESFTPDGNFIIGEAPEQPGLFVGTGFNAFGIAAGGGAGMALAEWVAHGAPPFDLWAADIRRFGAPHRDRAWVLARSREAYARHYTMAWPHEEHAAARPWRRSPLYRRLAEAGAVFGEKLGWERPNWFAAPGETPRDIYSFERPNWFEAVGREHRAVRAAAGLFDQSSFAKFALKGRGALEVLNRIAANQLDRPPGSLVYTQLLNQAGGIEADLTITRLGEHAFYIVTGTGSATRDFDWIARQIPPGAACRLEDVTESRATLSLMGPRARDILAGLTGDDISNAAFPFGQARRIEIAGRPVLALRVTYVGELGWELHLPVEDAEAVYEALMRAGAEHGLVNAGYRAIESLRLEKGYRAWGSDLSPDHTPDEAGLGWAVRPGKGDFTGRAAVLRQRARGLKKRLACFSVAPEVVLLGRETIYRNGRRVGWLTSGGHGYTVGRSIGYGYVRNREGVDGPWLAAGSYELEVATKRVPARFEPRPLYDPDMRRVRA